MVEHAGSVAWAFVSLSMHWLLAGKCSTLISVSRSAYSCKLQGSVHVWEHVTNIGSMQVFTWKMSDLVLRWSLNLRTLGGELPKLLVPSKGTSGLWSVSILNILPRICSSKTFCRPKLSPGLPFLHVLTCVWYLALLWRWMWLVARMSCFVAKEWHQGHRKRHQLRV